MHPQLLFPHVLFLFFFFVCLFVFCLFVYLFVFCLFGLFVCWVVCLFVCFLRLEMTLSDF